MRGCAQLVDITTNPTHNAEFHVLKDGKEKCVGNGEKKIYKYGKEDQADHAIPSKVEDNNRIEQETGTVCQRLLPLLTIQDTNSRQFIILGFLSFCL